MCLEGSLCRLVNLRLGCLLLVYYDLLLFGLLLNSLIFLLLLDGLLTDASSLLLFGLGQRFWFLFRRGQLFVRLSIILGCLFNLGGRLVEFVLGFGLRGHLVLLGSRLSNGLTLGITVGLLSSVFVFSCADLGEDARVILPGVVRLYGEPSRHKFNITTQRQKD